MSAALPMSNAEGAVVIEEIHATSSLRSGPRFEIIELATSRCVYVLQFDASGSNVDRLQLSLMNNIGRFDARLCRDFDPDRYPEQEEHTEDNRLDTDRFYVRTAQ